MKTLQEHIDYCFSGKFPKNAYVLHPDFESLYIRISDMYIDGIKYSNVIQIANITAKNPGNGAFTRLFETLKHHHIFVESVLNDRFCVKLDSLGFKSVNMDEYIKHYFWFGI